MSQSPAVLKPCDFFRGSDWLWRRMEVCEDEAVAELYGRGQYPPGTFQHDPYPQVFVLRLEVL